MSAPATSACASCGADIIWCHDARTGKPAPVDAAPDPHGNVSVYLAAKGEARSVVLASTKASAARAAGLPLHLNHFASCPHADRWKSRGRR